MATINTDEINPFQAPRSAIGAPPVAASDDAVAIRRTYLRHEASVKSIGTLAYLGMVGGILGVIGVVIGAIASRQDPRAEQMSPAFVAVMAVVFLGFSALYGAMGYGLRRLQTWARWVTLVLAGLAVFYNVVQAALTVLVVPLFAPIILIGSVIPGYILYLVASSKGAMVFSPAYREVVRQTPHIRCGSGLLVKIVLGLLVIFILIALAAVLVGTSGR